MSGSTNPSPSGDPSTALDEPAGPVASTALAPSDPHVRRLGEFIDDLAGEVILRHVAGRRVLDVGFGAPRITGWVEARASQLTVLRPQDVAPPASRSLSRGGALALGVPDAAFDTVYCLRTLPHLGWDEASSEQATRSLLREMARSLVSGGTAIVQFNNPRSLWGLYHGIRNPMTVVGGGSIVVDGSRGLTRFDTLRRFMHLLPRRLTLTAVHGLRILITVPHILAIPVVGRLVRWAEWTLRDWPVARGFGAHLLVVLRRL